MRFSHYIALAVGFTFLLSAYSAKAQETTLKAEISKVYTLETMQQEARSGFSPYIDTEKYKAKNPDPECEAHLDAVAKGLKRMGDVGIVVTNSDTGRTYSIARMGVDEALEYDESCQLRLIQISENAGWPMKVVKYWYPSGALATTFMVFQNGNAYMFNPDGSLYGRWVGDLFIRNDGKLTGIREKVIKY